MVLVSPRNPLNIGAAARAMSNFGVLKLRVVNAYDVAFREARSAVGAASDVLERAEEFKSLPDAIADCTLVVGTTAVRTREILHPLHDLIEAAPLIRTELAANTVALVFGSERHGLTSDDLNYCNWLLRIRTRDEHISMNLGQAVAVCLYELVREQSAIGVPAPSPASAAEVERVTTVLLESLHESGYVKPRTEAETEADVRRMVRRLSLTSGDSELVLGMLRKMLWKMKAK